MAHINFGLSRADFVSNYLEKKPFHGPACFESAEYNWSVIDRALAFQDPSHEMLKVIKRRRVNPVEYTEEFVDIGLRRRRILKEKLYKYIGEGATLVLNRIELASEEVRDICLQVGRFTGMQTTANAYATIGQDPATSIHWDTHDVFIVQLKGRKRWEVYPPTLELPLENQVSTPDESRTSSEAFVDTELKAGDILYLPRGWWHRVTPVEGYDTIHLTVAIHIPLILDFLIWTSSNVLPQYLEFRRGLLQEPGDNQKVQDAAEKIATLLLSSSNQQAFFDRVQSRERSTSPFVLDRFFNGGNSEFSDNDVVSINSRKISERHPVLVNGVSPTLSEEENKLVQELSSVIDSDVSTLRSKLSVENEEHFQSVLRGLVLQDVVQLCHRPALAKAERTHVGTVQV